ncbi:class I lanthipeptide [Chitinophaga nivalis]|uniref:Class I lanthipeptide n=1 Tax=Chitinophaga nivalis TaxID=2991709 RepID=A0ABT3IHM0_9BACT|nr:class I lanthipeptide [Chitinophaga nivalis]MCW3467045.1 class I lanthipeptide [Chitinophaga nivalis]MCW3483264.1 class I lanthipeptide [Chitinophaga nivalis]
MKKKNVTKLKLGRIAISVLNDRQTMKVRGGNAVVPIDNRRYHITQAPCLPTRLEC